MTARVMEIYHDALGVPALNSQTIGADGAVNGASVDIAGFHALLFLVQSGTITDGAYDLKLQESDDASAWSDVSSDEQLGSPDYALADDNVVKRIGYIGKKRYVRLVITASSVTSGGVFSAIALKAQPLHAPVADDA